MATGCGLHLEAAVHPTEGCIAELDLLKEAEQTWLKR